jgi:hypothetical protein
MTPKEKAQELVDKIKPLCGGYWGGKINKEFSKKCVLLAIDEICEAINWHEFEPPNKEWDYWNAVKLEVERL